jgi:hypothetical protein
MLVELTPSMGVLLLSLLVPLTLKVSAREGFDGIECASSQHLRADRCRVADPNEERQDCRRHFRR